MNYREDVERKKREKNQKGKKRTKTAHEIAIDAVNKHNKSMEGIGTKLIPHPTAPRAWIEVIVTKTDK